MICIKMIVPENEMLLLRCLENDKHHRAGAVAEILIKRA